MTRRAGSIRTRAVLGAGLRLARLFGIDVVIDWSLLVIFGLIVVSLASGALPRWHPEWSPLFAGGFALVAASAFVASVLLHELAHALVGKAVGIPVRRITLFLFGGLAEIRGEARSAGAELLMAAAGPLASIGLGVIAAVASALLYARSGSWPSDPLTAIRAMGPLATLLFWLGPINLVLGVFNLVPGFPLDGGRVLHALLWWLTGNVDTATRWAALSGQLFASSLMALGVLMALGLRVPILGTGLVNGLWLVVIAWFLANAARASYFQSVIGSALSGVPVTSVMAGRVPTVDSELSLSLFVREHLMSGDAHGFAVIHDGELVGIVTMNDMRKATPSHWAEGTVADIMTPASELTTVDAGQDARAALQAMARRGVEQVPVLDHGRLCGLFRRADAIKWLTLHEHAASG